MQAGGTGANQRRGSRTKAVLPVRVKGKDAAGQAFEEMAHTLDVTTTGVRLGSIRRELNPQDEVTIFYRQRKMQIRVVWTKKMKRTSEFQVGLQGSDPGERSLGIGSGGTAARITQESFARASSIA